MIKIGICGANGRMGMAVIEAASMEPKSYSVVAKFTRKNSLDNLAQFCRDSEVVIDFSSTANLLPLIEQAVIAGTKIVIGVTGIGKEHYKAMKKASKDIAILYAPNTSIGINLIANLAAQSAKILRNYDIEIVEAHHKHKKDAPSGTALMLGKSAAAAKNQDLEEIAVYDRSQSGGRTDGEIGFSSIRGGGIFGEHTVIFAGANEIIRLEHTALNRSVFAEGALTAASWIYNKGPGLYSMKDVLAI